MKIKQKQMGPEWTYKLLHSKGNHEQNEKTTHKMGENIPKWSEQQGINLKIYKQLMQLNIKKQKQTTTKTTTTKNTTQSKKGQKI